MSATYGESCAWCGVHTVWDGERFCSDVCRAEASEDERLDRSDFDLKCARENEVGS